MISEFKHVQWILLNRKQELQTVLQQKGINLNAEQALDVMLAADPSQGKKAVDWLFNTWLGDGYQWEDIAQGKDSKVAETLALFARLRKNLNGSAKNLQNYTSIGKVYSAIQSFIETDKDEQNSSVSGKEAKRREKEAALSESNLIYRSENVIVGVPLTDQASKWWGRGTRWCTAADKNNMFNYYNNDSPLIIVMFPNGLTNSGPDRNAAETRKFQIWTTETSIQFMDEADSSVDPKLVIDNWNEFSTVIEWAWEQNKAVIKYFPSDKITYGMAQQAVEASGANINLLPEELVDLELIRLAGKQNDFTFVAMSTEGLKEKITQDLWNHILEVYPNYLHTIPRKYQTKEICVRSLLEAKFLESIVLVRDDLLDEELILNLINQSVYSRCSFEYIPKRFLSEKIVRAFAIRSEDNIMQIPREYLTERLISEIFQTHPVAWKLMDKKKLTRADITRIIKDDPRNLLYNFGTESVDISMILEILRETNILELDYIRNEYRTPEICMKMIVQDKFNMFEVPTCVLTESFLCGVVEINPELVSYIGRDDTDEFDPDLGPKLFAINPLVYMYLGEALKTPEMSKKIVELYPDRSWAIPWDHVDKEFALEILEKNPRSMECVPYELRTLEFCRIAIDKTDSGYRAGMIDSWVPYEIRPVVLELYPIQSELEPLEPTYTDYWGFTNADPKWNPNLLTGLKDKFTVDINQNELKHI